MKRYVKRITMMLLATCVSLSIWIGSAFAAGLLTPKDSSLPTLNIKDQQGIIIAIQETINETIRQGRSTSLITREVLTLANGQIISNKILHQTCLRIDPPDEHHAGEGH